MLSIESVQTCIEVVRPKRLIKRKLRITSKINKKKHAKVINPACPSKRSETFVLRIVEIWKKLAKIMVSIFMPL